MAKIRVYELARDLNMTNQALLDKIRSMHIDVKSHVSSLDDDTVAKIKAGIQPDIILADFTANKTQACDGQQVTFTNQSSGTVNTYSWNFGDGATPSTASTAGPHNVTYGTAGMKTVSLAVTGPAGSNTATKAAIVNVFKVVITPSVTNILCNGASTGSVSLTATGGNSPYSYVWSNSATSSAISNIAAGTYNVTITDTHGCTATHTFTLTNPLAWTAVLSPTATTCGLSNGSVTVSSVTNGTGPYTYAWSNGGNTQTITPLASGNYTVTVTGAGGCTAVATANVAASSAVTSTFTNTANQCLTGNSFNFTNTGSSGGGYSYSWTFPSGSPASATNNNVNNVTWAIAGTYTITHTVTGPGPCTSTTTSTITIYPQPTVTTTQTNITCNGLCNGTATANPSGAGYSYVWNDPAPVQTTQTASALCAGSYNVTLTNPNGCTGIGSVTITQPGVIVLNSSRTDVTCNGLCNGTANVVITSGGTGPFTYSWIPSALLVDALIEDPTTVNMTTTTVFTLTATSTAVDPLSA